MSLASAARARGAHGRALGGRGSQKRGEPRPAEYKRAHSGRFGCYACNARSLHPCLRRPNHDAATSACLLAVARDSDGWMPARAPRALRAVRWQRGAEGQMQPQSGALVVKVRLEKAHVGRVCERIDCKARQQEEDADGARGLFAVCQHSHEGAHGRCNPELTLARRMRHKRKMPVIGTRELNPSPPLRTSLSVDVFGTHEGGSRNSTARCAASPATAPAPATSGPSLRSRPSLSPNRHFTNSGPMPSGAENRDDGLPPPAPARRIMSPMSAA